MRNYDSIKKSFLERHKTIDRYDYLDKYINLLIGYRLDSGVGYTEKHHILPKCFFPEFKDEEWNIIELSYEDHRKAHLWIFKAVNNRKYQRPLNWMMNHYKDSKEISNAAKKGWINLKNNEYKYNKWRHTRSEYMKRLTSDEQSRRSKIFWNNISEETYLEFCNKMKGHWTKERRKDKSDQMNDYYSNLENIEKKRKETKDRWDKLDSETRLEFRKKMNLINKDKYKRLDAGEKIKEMWRDPEYLEKMRNRKKRTGNMIRLIKPSGEEIIIDTMRKFEEEYSFSTHLIRKYRDTNNKIPKNILNESNIILLDNIIESVKLK